MGTQILLNFLLSTAFFWCQWIRSVVLNFNLFIVEIPKNKNVNVLIKEKNPASSGNIDVKNIYKNSCQWDRKSFCRKRSAWSYKFYSNFTRWNVYCMPPVECYWNHVEKLQALQGSYTTGMEYYWAAIESKLEQTPWLRVMRNWLVTVTSHSLDPHLPWGRHFRSRSYYIPSTY